MNVLDAIKTRRSIRAYASRPIPPDVFDRMRQALRFAPSACNLQPWRFILVTDEQLRRQIAKLSHDQLWIADAPVAVVACGFPDQAYKTMGGYGNSVEIDVAIALDHLTLAAVAEGLGTCWIGAFDEKRIKALLHVPPPVKIVAMTPLGYPTSANLNVPIDENQRKAEPDVFSTNLF
ncbi:MAG: nitroreductase family protein [Planctomycetota bacterium]